MNLMYFKFFAEPSDFPFYLYYACHEQSIETHTHADFSELVVVLDGAAMHCVGNEVYFVKRGDVFVVNGDTEHGYQNTESFRICNIMYRPDIIASPYFDLCKSVGFHALFVIEPYLAKSQGYESRLTLSIDAFELVNAMITDMVDEYSKKRDGWKTVLHAHFMKLIAMLSRMYSLPASDAQTDIMNIAKTVSYMEYKYMEPISVSDLASLASLSERHYSRIFKDTYKITPGNYILSLRLQHACRLLKNTSIKISDIAMQSGFNDSNYFTRRFHKTFGVAPSEYRLKHCKFRKKRLENASGL